MTIHLPGALAAEVKARLAGTNISAVGPAALRAGLERRRQWRRPTLTATSG